jgi:GNAT superfamily N-acetyltransferase
MEITFAPALDFTLAELADALNTAFRGYFIEVHFTPQSVGQMVRCDSVDLNVSRCVLLGGIPVGVALIARRGWTSRLAAMGLNTQQRGQGIGRRVMELLITEAAERGERAMVLEVIEQNTAALQLYTAMGFRTVRRLVSYVMEAQPAIATASTGDIESALLAEVGGPDRAGAIAAERECEAERACEIAAIEAAIEEVDLRNVARSLTMVSPDDFPWQLSGETLAQQGPPNRGYRLDAAFVALSNPTQAQVTIRAIGSSAPDETPQHEHRLLRALMAANPGKTWKAPPLFPEETATTLFEPLGFRREALTLLQMERRL